MSSAYSGLEPRIQQLRLTPSSSSSSSSTTRSMGGATLAPNPNSVIRRVAVAAAPNSATRLDSRTYINVLPATIASQHGAVIRNPGSRTQWPVNQPFTPVNRRQGAAANAVSGTASGGGSGNRIAPASIPHLNSSINIPTVAPTTPVIPQSQEVKQFIREPSYSTILQLQREGSSSIAATATPASRAATTVRVATPTAVPPPPIYANYSALSSTYSEGLKSSDSQGSGEEEILGIVAASRSATAGSIYNSPPSPVSSSYSELRQATKYPPGNSIIHPFRNVVKSFKVTSCPSLPLSKVIICNSICNNKGNRQRPRAVEEVAEPPPTSLFTSPFRIQPPVLLIISTTQSSNSSTRAPRAAGGRRPPTLRGRRVGNRR